MEDAVGCCCGRASFSKLAEKHWRRNIHLVVFFLPKPGSMSTNLLFITSPVPKISRSTKFESSKLQLIGQILNRKQWNNGIFFGNFKLIICSKKQHLYTMKDVYIFIYMIGKLLMRRSLDHHAEIQYCFLGFWGFGLCFTMLTYNFWAAHNCFSTIVKGRTSWLLIWLILSQSCIPLSWARHTSEFCSWCELKTNNPHIHTLFPPLSHWFPQHRQF